MIINSINFKNFRNYVQKELDFSDGINVIYGNNGVGKTSILEAISICSLSRSFTTTADIALVNKDSDKYYISANCTNDLDMSYKVSVSFSPNNYKHISSSKSERLSPKDIVGEIPLVVLSPEYKKITSSSPEHRRQFINGLLSQISKNYLEKLYENTKILKQRNVLLAKFKLNPNNKILLPMLPQWTQALINVSTFLIIHRNEFINNFNPIFIESYKAISNSEEEVNLIYQPDSINETIISKEQVAELLVQHSTNILDREIRRFMTLFGAQRDDIKICINNLNSREYASQGQHKSLLIALKFTEFKYLLEKRNETPIILFDDIFSELDNIRIAKVLELLAKSKAQIFITLTDPTIIKNATNISTNLIEIK